MNTAMMTAKPVNSNVSIESDEKPAIRNASWKPRWTIDLGGGDEIGIAIDDGCFVVLYPHGNSWRPGKHIPKDAASRISELLKAGALD